MKRLTLACVIALVLSPLSTALAGPVDEKLGESYTSAPPHEKLVLIAVALTDKILDHKETSAAVAEVSTAEVNKGTDPKQRLELLGKLREEAQAKLKEVNKGRKKEKKRFASFREPDSYFQQALALAYISFATGPKPTLEQLGCLKLVRKSTNWSSHHSMVLATAMEAFARDKAFMDADFAGKLAVVKKHAEDRGMLSDHERTYIEKSILAEWLNAQLHAGKTVKEISDALGQLKDRKQICFFTSSWANGILKRMAEFPAPTKSD